MTGQFCPPVHNYNKPGRGKLGDVIYLEYRGIMHFGFRQGEFYLLPYINQCITRDPSAGPALVQMTQFVQSW